MENQGTWNLSDEVTLENQAAYVSDMRLTQPLHPFLQVPTSLTRWPTPGLRRASVNCFGFGGTNAHVILDDAWTYMDQRALRGNCRATVPPFAAANAATTWKEKTFASNQLFTISSHEKDGIARITEGHHPYITKNEVTTDILPDYAFTLSRRSALEYRTFVVAETPQELATKFSNHHELPIHRFVADDTTPARLALVFCGQGPQWHAMGRELMEYDVYRNSIVSAARYLNQIVGSDFDLLQEMNHQDPALSHIHEAKFSQPAITALQVALVDLLMAADIVPDAVVGHSSGEIAAAYAAGFITREAAWLIAFQRGQHATRLCRLFPGLKGRMMAVGLSVADAQHYIGKLTRGTVVVACENSPVSVTLSGDEEQILRLAKYMSFDGVFHRLLEIKTAYHSNHMCQVEAAYRQSIKDVVSMSTTSGPLMFSSVTGQVIQGSALSASYWAQNLTSPVLFDTAFTAMYNAIKPKLVIEVSPAKVLNRPIQEIMNALYPKKNKVLPCVPMLKRDSNASVTTLEAFGELWARGVPFNLQWSLKSKEGHLPQLLVDLPPYPFNHSKTYWFESHLGTDLRFRKHGREDLIGAPLPESTPQEPHWRGFFRIEENPWLVDHQVQKAIIYPASGLITMALEAARQCAKSTLLVETFQISDFRIAKPVLIPAGDHGLEHTINAKILRSSSPDATQGSTVYSFTIFTRTENGQWQENADGKFTIFYQGKNTKKPGELPVLGGDYKTMYNKVQAECNQVVNPRHLYERLDGIGLNYGPLFQNIAALSKCNHACTSVVRIPDTESKMPAQYEFDHLIHPATLDTMFQTVFSISDTTMVPSYIGQISFSPDMLKGAGAEFHGFATATMKGYRAAQADIIMSDEAFSKPMVVVKGMEFVKISSDASGFLPNNRHLCSEMIWQEQCPVPTSIDDSTVFNKGAPIVLLLPDGDLSDLTTSLVEHLTYPNVECVRLSQLSEECMKKPCISLVESEQAVLFKMSEVTFEQIKRLLMTTPGLLWVTKGGQKSAHDPTMAPFVGLARSVRSEDSSKRIAILDLDSASYQHDLITCASAILHVFDSSCLQSDIDQAVEVEYSLEANMLYTARLSPLHALNNVIEKGEDEAIQIEQRTLNDLDDCVELKIGTVGDIGSTYFMEDQNNNRPLGPNEVRVLVDCTNLFQIDFETIMGKNTETNLGADIIGRVTGVGDAVTDLTEGNFVVGLARGTLRMSTNVDRGMVQLLQDRSKLWGLSPTTMVTAYYALNNIGCISKGDMVFINHAAGPYGDAALTMAATLGATVFAGVLNEEDRDFIHKEYKIPLEHIIYTNNDRFPEEIMRLTGGMGVDFLFSSTTDHVESSAQCVATHGHLFLLMDTNGSASKLTVIPTNSNISVHKFDLYALAHKRPKVVTKAWNEVYGLHLSGMLGCCPQDLVREERVEHMEQLWRSMANTPGRYLNTLTFTDESIVRVGENPLHPAELDPNATYVLVGGLGGLGKSVAALLVKRGACHLLFVSRSGIKSAEDAEFIQSLFNQGVQAIVLAVDICDEQELRKAIVAANMPPIKGAVQCAAVIADAVFETMSYDEWATATRPKMIGSWNLHNVLPQEMDFFVLLSSASGVIGNRGQGNYAAGNCFQDALARYRSAMGFQNSVSIDLGPVLGAGMLENDDNTLAILKASGFFMVEVDNFLFLVDRAISGKNGSGPFTVPAQVITGVGTGGLILQNEVPDPFWAETRMFDILNRIDVPQVPSNDGSSNGSRSSTPTSFTTTSSSASAGRSLSHALKQADSLDEASEAILCGCVAYLSSTLSTNANNLDTNKSLTAYGVDSLVTSSFRNWIFKNAGVKITDMEMIGAASIAELAQHIAEKGSWGQ